jgi:small subunit ribosomal protein S2
LVSQRQERASSSQNVNPIFRISIKINIMSKPTYQDLLDAGVHYGHMKRKWNPKMLPYIFMERKGIHIIDLNRTSECLDRSAFAAKKIVMSGRKILFVATKKQAKDIVSEAARSVGMPYVTERWLGGMMTNFATIRRSVKKMQNIDRMLNDSTLTSITKKERLTLTREKGKLEKELGGIANLNRIPSALFIVDIHHEHIALAEAKKLGIKTFGMVDTNSDPNKVDFPIPANDDASKSVKIIVNYIVEAIKEGLEERRLQGSTEEA